jgi:hypothetical protein
LASKKTPKILLQQDAIWLYSNAESGGDWIWPCVLILAEPVQNSASVVESEPSTGAMELVPPEPVVVPPVDIDVLPPVPASMFPPVPVVPPAACASAMLVSVVTSASRAALCFEPQAASKNTMVIEIPLESGSHVVRMMLPILPSPTANLNVEHLSPLAYDAALGIGRAMSSGIRFTADHNYFANLIWQIADLLRLLREVTA